MQWHTGHDVEPGPVGSPIVGMVELPAGVLPVRLEPTELRLTDWPSVVSAPADAAAMTRLPLFRLAGQPGPRCDVSTYLDPHAHAGARARGTALVARLCGGGLSRDDRARVAEAIEAEASGLASPDDRYDAYRVFPDLGLPISTSVRRHLDRERSRHTYFDEIALAWSATELKPGEPSPEQARAGLGALLLARQYDRLLLVALGRGLARRPEVQDLLCEAVAALGLRSRLMPDLVCSNHPNHPLRVLIQGFENASDPSLHFDNVSRTWLVSRPPASMLGGQGRSFLFVPPCVREPCSEAIWGPLPWSGSRFGVLLAGPGKGTSVVVEARDGAGWIRAWSQRRARRSERPHAADGPVACTGLWRGAGSHREPFEARRHDGRRPDLSRPGRLSPAFVLLNPGTPMVMVRGQREWKPCKLIGTDYWLLRR